MSPTGPGGDLAGLRIGVDTLDQPHDACPVLAGGFPGKGIFL